MEQLSIKFEYTDEFFTDVKGFEGLYKVSNYGRVWSCRNEKFLTPDFDRNGYEMIKLCKQGFIKRIKIHRLVFYTFYPKTDIRLEINHIDKVMTNNFLVNLEAVNNRENNTHRLQQSKKSSKYVGVSLDKRNNRWRSTIIINQKQKSLGYYSCETAAYLAYIKALKQENLTNKYA